MDQHIQTIFVHEIERQARFGLIAVDDMHSALSGHNVERVWYSVQGLLIAAGHLSKILWPGKAHEGRGQVLRKLLSVSDESVLAPRRFRNHFEHFDERLEAWASSSARRNFVDSNVGLPAMITGIEPDDYLRNFDTKNLVVTFRGDAYSLQPIANAIEELYGRAAQVLNAG